MLRRRAAGLVIGCAFAVGACGTSGGDDTESIPPVTPVETVPGVGQLPDTVPDSPIAGISGDDEPIVSVVVTRPVDDQGVVVESVAERVNGNRLLVVGDSILASTATRYGKELCDALNPIGWTVAVEAEPGRFVEFGNKVLDTRLPNDVSDEDDFDAAIVHLGSNYDLDEENFYEELSEVLWRIAPRPTLLLTVTEYRPAWAEVNDVIDELASLYDNVTIVDWEKIARSPGVLSRDGLHPGDQGEGVLVEQIAVALGSLGADDGECLRSSFTDDSAIGAGGGGSSGSSSGGSSGSSSRGSSGGSSSGSSSSGSSGGSSSGGSSGGSSSGGSSGGSSSGTTGGSGSTTGSTTGGTDSTGGDTTGDTDSTGGTDTGGGSDSTGGDTTGGTDSTGGTDTGGGSDSTGGTDSGGGTDSTGGTDSGGSSGGSDAASSSGGSDGSGTTTSGGTGGSTSATTGSDSGGSDSGGSATAGSSSGSSGGSSGSTSSSGSGGAATSGATGGGSDAAAATGGGDAVTTGADTGG